LTKTLTVEGDISAVDTATNLTTQGSVSAPSRVTPAGVSRVARIIAGVAPDMAAEGRATFLVRIGGDAVKQGEQTIVIAAAGGQLPQAGADPTGISPIMVEMETDIEIDPVETIRIQGEMASQDLGTARMVVTLVFA